MSARGYCTDCESWTLSHNGRCSCGSGRVITPPAGYRILAPGELDRETVERCAEDVNGVDPELLAGMREVYVSIYCASRRDASDALRTLKDGTNG